MKLDTIHSFPVSVSTDKVFVYLQHCHYDVLCFHNTKGQKDVAVQPGILID